MARTRTDPDLTLLDGTVHPQILAAMHTASVQLDSLGVRHALIGGLAVGAYGVPRATKDVDFLVGEEAFVHHGGGLVTLAPGVPFSVAGVAVDTLWLPEGGEPLARMLDEAPRSDGVPVLPVEAVVHLKLLAHRQKDKADVVELIKAGARVAEIRAHLAETAPGTLALFEECLSMAAEEGERQ
jgi:hypothetical protein